MVNFVKFRPGRVSCNGLCRGIRRLLRKMLRKPACDKVATANINELIYLPYYYNFKRWDQRVTIKKRLLVAA